MTKNIRNRSDTGTGPSRYRDNYPCETRSSQIDSDYHSPRSRGRYATLANNARIVEATGGPSNTSAGGGSAVVTGSQDKAAQHKRGAEVSVTNTRQDKRQPNKEAKPNPKSTSTSQSDRCRLYVSIYESHPSGANPSRRSHWGLFLQIHNHRGWLHEVVGADDPLLYREETTPNAIPEDNGRVREKIPVGYIDDPAGYYQAVSQTPIYNNDDQLWVMSALEYLRNRNILDGSDVEVLRLTLISFYGR